MMGRSLHAFVLAGTVLVLLGANGPPTGATLPPGTPAGLVMADSALGALLNEVNAEPVSTQLMTKLDKQIGHARQQIARAAGFAVANQHKQAKAALKQAGRWVISFRHLVRSRAGRKGGADATKLVPMAKAILDELQTVRATL